MPIVADSYRFVVGVDTHAATHQFVIIQTDIGRVVDTAGFPTSPAGLARAVAWIGRRTQDVAGTLICAEGTGSYGAGLARLLSSHGYRVVDAPSPKRNRGADKTDQIDALIAARDTLGRDVDQLADARGGQLQATLKVLLAARDQMTTEHTRAINALIALLRTAILDIDTRHRLTLTTIKTIAGWRRRDEPMPIDTARREAVRLARRILELDTQITANYHQLQAVIIENAPFLLDLVGVGPVNAAVVLSVWSHPGRIRTEAGCAKIAGVNPIQIASGNSHERRLNRGGDRQLNRAIHQIAVSRMHFDSQTRAYVARRTQEGLSKARIRRCLKRYIARQLHQTLRHGLQHQQLTRTA